MLRQKTVKVIVSFAQPHHFNMKRCFPCATFSSFNTTAIEPHLGHEFNNVRLQATEDAARETTSGKIVRPSWIARHEGLQTLGLMAQAQSSTSSGSGDHQRMMEEAKFLGFIRCQRAYERLAGIVPPSPPGRPDMTQVWKMKARSLAIKLFGTSNPNIDKITEIVFKMRNKLSSPLNMVKALSSDAKCGNRAGYVIDYKPPVYLCPLFFSGSREERIRTMIHESAHLAGVGEPIGESYCVYFDCETSCGDANVADSWAHFVHCLSGQIPDRPE